MKITHLAALCGLLAVAAGCTDDASTGALPSPSPSLTPLAAASPATAAAVSPVSSTVAATPAVTSAASPAVPAAVSPSVDPGADKQQRLLTFLKQQQAVDVDHPIVFQAEEDLDADGSKELVVATGDEDSLYCAYVLRDRGKRFDNLSGDGGFLDSSGYMKKDIRFIKLHGSQKTYIYLTKTNGGGLNGFELYELQNNAVSYLDGYSNATGAGEGHLTDADAAGAYGGYIGEWYSYDVNYVPITRMYAFNGKTFDLKEADVSLQPIPVEPEGVLEQFLSLSTLLGENRDLPAVQERLKHLATDGFVLNISEDDISAIRTMITVHQIDVKPEQNEDDRLVFPLRYSENGEKLAIDFQLVRQSGRWLVQSLKQAAP